MTVTGVLVCKNQAHLCELAIESSRHVCDEYLLIDNDSMDGTFDRLEALAADLDVPATVEQQAGYYPPILEEAMNRADDIALRLEGDQVYYPDHLEAAVDMVLPGRVVNARVWLMRTRFNRQNSSETYNAPHPVIYDASRPLVTPDPLKIPRGADHVSTDYPEPIGINIRVNGPAERILRHVRQAWFNRPGKSLNRKWQLDGYERPYSQHFTQEEFVFALQAKAGSDAVQWAGDTLEEIGQNHIEWDLKHNCIPFEGAYPPALKRFLREHDTVKGQPIFEGEPPEWY